eukprot:SAG31_NODE_4486_length_3194_cov_7.612278_2_plen_150_part_00
MTTEISSSDDDDSSSDDEESHDDQDVAVARTYSGSNDIRRREMWKEDLAANTTIAHLAEELRKVAEQEELDAIWAQSDGKPHYQMRRLINAFPDCYDRGSVRSASSLVYTTVPRSGCRYVYYSRVFLLGLALEDECSSHPNRVFRCPLS